MRPDVVVVGSYAQDFFWRCAVFPGPGETVLGAFAQGPGGKGSNQAVAAARAGATTCLVAAVGDDVFGAEARHFLRGERIVARLVTKPRHATGTAAVLLSAAGQNEIVVAAGANAALSPRDVPARLVQQARVVITQLESNLRTTAHVLATARRAGVTTILNPAPMRRDFEPRLLDLVDILIPNEAEFQALLAHRDRARREQRDIHRLSSDRLQQLCRSLGPRTVIVTLGARGCFVSQPDIGRRIAAHRVKVADTAGAGDAFIGGFAAGLVRHGGDPECAARFAHVVAALSVTRPGTARSMPQEAGIRRFIRRHQISIGTARRAS